MRFTTMAAIVLCAVNASVVTSAGADRKTNAVAPSVTVTGCLEREDTAFRLTDTSGAQAPRERSWKTAFIRKRNNDLDVVETAKKLKLKDHVGHRVSLTGTVADGELRAASVRHLAASCGQ
jgi:hypothetical protein